MIELELQERPPLGLDYALLIYSGGGKEVAVTKNAIKDGVIQPGEPLDVESFIEGFSTKVSAAAQPTAQPTAQGDFVWTDPALLAENSQWRVWWTKAQTRKLFIAGKPKLCWLPSLIWAGHRRQHVCYLWAFTGRTRPTVKTICYRPRFGPTDGTNHIRDSSAICLGTMNPGRFSPKEWTDAFYDTNFKTGDGLPSKPHAIQKTYKKLGALADRLASLSCGRAAD